MSAKKRILIVDDDPDVVDQLTLALQGQGYEIVSAGSQAEAEETLLTVRPDLAIFDLMMEEKDSGFVLCHHMKKLYPETPVIMLTAVTAATGISFSAQSPEARSWIKADKVLDKPVRPEQIRVEVRKLLNEPEPAAEHHAPADHR
ncbi:MAG TPA: response regulator [Planctomycetes bacterium]|nr:response regulator [Planctomycetota bacterium]